MLNTSTHSTLVVIEPNVPMTLPNAVELLQRMEAKLHEPGIRDLVLDLQDVVDIDGAGLGAVVKTATDARANGKGFYLYRPSPSVLSALEEHEILGFFPLLEHEEDLLAHLPD